MSQRKVSNSARLTDALNLLQDGLAPFVEQRTRRFGQPETQRRFEKNPRDLLGLLKWMARTWDEIFAREFSRMEKSLVEELRDWRNAWAHQKPISDEDAYRVLDSTHRLLGAIRASQADRVGVLKQEQLRVLNGPELLDEDLKPAVAHSHGSAPAGSQADRIRQHALRYVEDWRRSGQRRLSIRAGDVHRELSLRSAAPNVCNALRGRKFLELANIKLVGHTEPCPSTTTVFYYERA